MRHHLAAIRLLLLSATLLLATPAAHAQQVWFGTRLPAPGATAMQDWDEMFQPNSNWQRLAPKIQVFFPSSGMLLQMPDDRMQAMANALAAGHIALGMPVQSVAKQPGDKCGGQEGYGDAWVGPKVIEKLTRFGIRLRTIRLDGPLWFGRYDPSGTACRLEIPDLARRVAQTVRPFLAAFPDIEVGDVEGPQGLALHSDWQREYREFKRVLEGQLGRPLTYLHADVNFRHPGWGTATAGMARFARDSGMRFGVIYDSDNDASSGQAWNANAKAAFDEMETLYGVVPDHAVFQTWSKLPARIFPETANDAHSWLVAQYRLPRTWLSVTRTATTVQGTLKTQAGAPVAGATVTLEAVGDDPNRPPPLREVDGVVPPQARFAIVGLRVNSECLCAGDNDLLVGPLSYAEGAGGRVRYEHRFEPPRSAQGRAGATGEAISGTALVHLRVDTAQNFGVNSPIFAVTPGARFQLQVPIGSRNGQGLFGTATVIWLDQQQRGFQRSNIEVRAEAQPIANATTDAAGQYAVTLPPGPDWMHRRLQVHFAGSPALRAALTGLSR